MDKTARCLETISSMLIFASISLVLSKFPILDHSGLSGEKIILNMSCSISEIFVPGIVGVDGKVGLPFFSDSTVPIILIVVSKPLSRVLSLETSTLSTAS